jgi:hypothetical protein
MIVALHSQETPMSDSDGSFEPVLARIVKSIEELEAQLTQKKRLANELCREYGRPPRYPDAEGPKTVSTNGLGRDIYYGRPLATVMKEFLESRGPSNRGGLGAATVNEIYDALSVGGFKFESKDEANAKRGLRIALSKNTAVFHKVGTGSGSDAYGLTEWYPSVRVRPQSRGSVTDTDSSQAPDTED